SDSKRASRSISAKVSRHSCILIRYRRRSSRVNTIAGTSRPIGSPSRLVPWGLPNPQRGTTGRLRPRDGVRAGCNHRHRTGVTIGAHDRRGRPAVAPHGTRRGTHGGKSQGQHRPGRGTGGGGDGPVRDRFAPGRDRGRRTGLRGPRPPHRGPDRPRRPRPGRDRRRAPGTAGPSGGPSRRPGALAAGRAARHHGTWGRAALVIPVFRRTAVSILVPVVFALAAAFSNALATVLQRKAALTVPRSDTLRAGLMLD